MITSDTQVAIGITGRTQDGDSGHRLINHLRY